MLNILYFNAVVRLFYLVGILIFQLYSGLILTLFSCNFFIILWIYSHYLTEKFCYSGPSYWYVLQHSLILWLNLCYLVFKQENSSSLCYKSMTPIISDNTMCVHMNMCDFKCVGMSIMCKNVRVPMQKQKNDCYYYCLTVILSFPSKCSICYLIYFTVETSIKVITSHR